MSTPVQMNDSGQFSLLAAASPLVAGGGVNSNGVQTSGAFPTLTLVSGTAMQAPARDCTLWIPVTYSPTVGGASTCTIQLSPDGITWSTVSVETYPAGLTAGRIDSESVPVRAAYYIKVTVVNATIGTVTYW